jgi:hypothetical protein
VGRPEAMDVKITPEELGAVAQRRESLGNHVFPLNFLSTLTLSYNL